MTSLTNKLASRRSKCSGYCKHKIEMDLLGVAFSWSYFHAKRRRVWKAGQDVIWARWIQSELLRRFQESSAPFSSGDLDSSASSGKLECSLPQQIMISQAPKLTLMFRNFVWGSRWDLPEAEFVERKAEEKQAWLYAWPQRCGYATLRWLWWPRWAHCLKPQNSLRRAGDFWDSKWTLPYHRRSGMLFCICDGMLKTKRADEEKYRFVSIIWRWISAPLGWERNQVTSWRFHCPKTFPLIGSYK